MAVYRYKASIPESKVFMREYEIKGDITLYDLHEYLLNDLDFAPDQMVLFKTLNAANKNKSEYGLFDMGDGSMDCVTIDDVIAKEEKHILYVFDLNRNRYIQLTLVCEVPEVPRTSYPRLTAEKGRNPDQFAKGYDDLDQFDEPIDDLGESSAIDIDDLPEGEEYI